MKWFLSALGFAIALTAVAADQTAIEKYFSQASISPIVVVSNPRLTDNGVLGAGLDLGIGINKFVSLHVDSIGYERNQWRGSAIDESSLLVRADLTSAYDEKFRIYGLASGTRGWQTRDWAFAGGLGLELRLSDKIGLFADSRIRAWFGNTEKDLLTRAGLRWSF